ncbi:PDZ domain-containing protein [Marinisporobacter balticus]|uniref:PDZ domain-containing protein n=1 Tax=Marinisporobacter balticus TaxID=2018667 RepID=A0A4R2KL47_9FIRM|nr:PDZ domain-containing protein [Marinisporobacter balticus]TCO70748.1 hypothetical protein EV214_12436 [Marinisporobacter balticus]
MFAFLELLQIALLTIITVFLNPFFWVVIGLIYTQYKRIYEMKRNVVGETKISIKDMTINAVGIGVMGGIVGTIVIMIFGITIDPRDFYFILPLAILLMLINVRYICFSYSGGFVALSSLIFGVPKLNVSSIIAIIAILHLIESILIYFDGYKEAVPIFVENKKYGLVGGFSMQRFWPIPFAVLILAAGQLAGTQEVNLPDWWPLFKASKAMENIPLQITAVVAALGYGDMVLSDTPRNKCKKSAKRLFVYSVVLLILSVISTRLTIFKWIATLFAPLAHEYLIIISQREEKSAVPIFRKHSSGITILDVKKDGVGMLMGLKQGDVMIKINNTFVNEKENLQDVLDTFPPYIWMEVIDSNGNRKTLEHKNYQTGINNLGLVIVPKDSTFVFDIQTSTSILKRIIEKIGSKKTM